MDAKWLRNSFFYFIVLVFLIAFLVAIFNRGGSSNPNDLSALMAAAKADARGGHQDVLVQDGQNLTLTGRPNGGPEIHASLGSNDTLSQYLTLYHVDPTTIQIKNQPPSSLNAWIGIFGGFIPVLIFGGLLLFMMRQAQGSNNQALSFGKSRARMFTGNRPTVTFMDVAGVGEGQQELAEGAEFFKYPEKVAALGARIPRGVLLIGSPGTGKTLLARAVAGEAGGPLFRISGSQVVGMFGGGGARPLRGLFGPGQGNAPHTVLVGGIDGVGPQR